jgi:hypothetical protein
MGLSRQIVPKLDSVIFEEGPLRTPSFALAMLLAFTVCASAQTPIDVQPVRDLQPGGALATCNYTPAAAEAPFFSRLSNAEKTNDSAFGGDYSLHGKGGTYVSWFGIVRGISPSAAAGEITLLAQHHYFDGTTDCHIMLVAKTGDGDFEATLKIDPAKIPALALVRIYGKVTGDDNGVPQVKVEYVRVWPWLTFTFADQADTDHSNPRWQRFAQVKLGDRIYTPYPDESYYQRVLGDPREFGVNLKTD